MTKKVKYLRVTADDFGLTKGVTDGIIKCHKDGILTHTSIMCNSIDFERAIDICKGIPTLNIGVHLNLTYGMPLIQNANSLINKYQSFYDLKNFVIKYIMGKISKEQIYKEWSAQISKVLNLGIKITHLDSHHHIHMLPGVNKIIKECARNFSVPYIRNTSEMLSFKEKGMKINLKKLIFLFLSIINSEGSKSYEFKGLYMHGKKNFKTLLMNLINNLNFGVTELMVHPGFPDSQLADQDSYVNERLIELNALCSKEIIELIDSKNIILLR